MDAALKQAIIEIIDTGKDLTLATLREDGWPQATTVSYASQGLSIYFGCGAQSQKARNLARDNRVSLTITLPYGPWSEIRGLSLGGRALRLTDPDDLAHAAGLFMARFGPEMTQYVPADNPELAQDMVLFQIVPTAISVLDYRKGFGHTQLVAAADLVESPAPAPTAAPAAA